MRFARHRARLLICVVVAILLFALLPPEERLTSRALVAWDAGVLLYSALATIMMARSDLGRIQDRARAEDEGAAATLVLLLGVASLAAIAAELHGISRENAPGQAIRLALAMLTILCSWFFVNLIFAIHYAHDY